MSEYKGFFEYFSKYPRDNDLKDILQSAKVKKVYASKEERKLKAYVIFNVSLSKNDILFLENSIANVYTLSKVKIIDCYTSLDSAEYLVNIVDQLKAEIPVLSGYCDGEFDFNGDVLSLVCKFGGEDILKTMKCDVKASEFLKMKFDCDITVKFKTKTACEMSLEEYEEKINALHEKERALSADATVEIHKPTHTAPGRRIMGDDISGEITDISLVKMNSGIVNVQGTIASSRRIAVGDNAQLMIFSLEGKTAAIDVRFYINEKNLSAADEIHDGDYVTVRGKASEDTRSGGVVLKAYSIVGAEKEERIDISSLKRSELHIHSTMSTADGLSSPEAIVEKAINWGLHAVAITDHGCVQAFPKALKAAEGSDLKVICGMEGYYVNDSEAAVYGSSNIGFKDRFVVFDIETTGLSASSDRITEIGAVVLENGEQKEVFGTFVNPHIPIPKHIVELTGITDDMVKDAPEENEALQKFFDFIKDGVLVAHNANFDCGFIRAAAKRNGMDFDYTYIDTVPICRSVFPELKSVKLNIVAEHIGASEFNHHRAYDDAKELAEIFVYLMKRLSRSGDVTTIGAINSALKGDSVSIQRSSHITLLAKNKTGLDNMYRIISASFDKYYQKYPIITRSLLAENREGLLVGSSCCDGEIFKMFLDGRSDEDIKNACSFYDYLEIQPLSNNMNMVDSGYLTESDQLRKINSAIIEYGKELNIPVCATGDAHFLEEEQEPLRDIALAVRGNRFDHTKGPVYFKTSDEMLADFEWLDKDTAVKLVIDNPNMIADMCEDLSYSSDGTNVSDDKIRLDEFLPIIYNGEKSNRRLERERSHIEKNGLENIFLFAKNISELAKSEGYPCVFCGDISTYYTAFCMGLTDIDPELYDIDFERDIDKTVLEVYIIPEFKYSLMCKIDELYGEKHYFFGSEIEYIPQESARGYVLRFEENNHTAVRSFIAKRAVEALKTNKRQMVITTENMYIVPKNMDYFNFSPIYNYFHGGENMGPMSHYDNESLLGKLNCLKVSSDADAMALRYLEISTGIPASSVNPEDTDIFDAFEKKDGIISDGLEGIFCADKLRTMLTETPHSVYDIIRAGFTPMQALNVCRLLKLKNDYPEKFYAAVFSASNIGGGIFISGKDVWIKGFSKDPSSETTVLRALYDMSERGIVLSGWSLYDSSPFRFAVKDKDIFLPLTMINGVAVKDAIRVEKERLKGEFLSVDELKMRCELSKEAVSGMREAGLFEGMDENAQLSMFNLF